MSYDTTYVEGVPVKISEKYRPPRRVTLSSSCNYNVNTEVLAAEYDISTEQECVRWLHDLKIHKETKRKNCLEKIKKYNEEKEKRKAEELLEKQAQEEERMSKEKEKEKLNEKEESENNDSDNNTNPQNHEHISEDEPCKVKNLENSLHTEKTSDENSNEAHSQKIEVHTTHTDSNAIGYNEHNSQVSLSSSYLPQSYPPMLVPIQYSLNLSQQNTSTKSSCNINFADFEGDSSDPFDSVALKSINDMEELAKVLQTSNLKQQKGYQFDSCPNQQAFSYQQQGGMLNGGYSYNNYQFPNYQQTSLPIHASIYNHISNYQSKTPVPSVPSSAKSNRHFQNDTSSTHNYSQWNHISCNPNPSSIKSSQFKPYNYIMPQANMLSSSNADPILENSMPQPFPKLPSGQMASSSLVGSSLQSNNSRIESESKLQDLEDFYTRYYSNKRSPPSGVHSGDNTPTISHHTSKTLSSSTSVPDLTTVEDSEVSDIVSSTQNERLQFKGTNNFKLRPSSTGGYECTSKAFQQTTDTSHGPLKPRLPDPFTELTDDAQSIVQSMAEMGFPRARVARAVQKLGTDHKKLLEVLLTLQSFQENGEDEYRAERAFYFFMGEVSKVNEFLHASKTLLDLGFEEEKVIENLFKHHNDKDKCLEELIA